MIAHQHQHRSGHRVQEELDRRVDAAVVAPDADQEIHRHQRDFPEHVEQEKSSAQNTPTSPNSSSSRNAKNSLTRFSMERHEISTQSGVSSVVRDHQPQADAVDADVIVNRRASRSTAWSVSNTKPRRGVLNQNGPISPSETKKSGERHDQRRTSGSSRACPSEAAITRQECRPAAGRYVRCSRPFIARLPNADRKQEQ